MTGAPLPPCPPLPPIAIPAPMARPVASPPTPPPPPTLCASSAIEFVPVAITEDAIAEDFGRIDRDRTAIAAGCAGHRRWRRNRPWGAAIAATAADALHYGAMHEIAGRLLRCRELSRCRGSGSRCRRRPQTRRHPPRLSPSWCSHLGRRRRHWLGRGPLALSD